MPVVRKYPLELRDRAVRLVLEAKEQEPDGSWNQTYVRIGHRLDVNPATLRGWVERYQIDHGQRAGTTTDDAARIKALEREVKELRRANEILLAASSFFAARSSTREGRGEPVYH